MNRLALILLFAFAGCLPAYQGPAEGTSPQTSTPSPAPAAPTDPPPSTPPSTTPSTPPTTPSTPPSVADLGQPAAPPRPPDLGAPAAPPSANCAALADCCQQLPPDYAAQCQDALQNASDSICQNILTQLEDSGVCP